MGRIRSIKPEFFTDSKIVSLPIATRYFFIGTWSVVLCGHGHLPDDPVSLRLQIMPADDVDVDAIITALIECGVMARVTTTDGRSFLHVVNFERHQKLDKRWSPRCPVCQDHTETPRASPNHAETPPNSPQEGNREGNREKRSPSTAQRSTDSDPDFDRFWEIYPRKVGKGEARKAWTKQRKIGTNPDEIIAGAKRYRDDPERLRQEPKFTKHPGPWLNAERWTDQLTNNTIRGPIAWWDA